MSIKRKLSALFFAAFVVFSCLPSVYASVKDDTSDNKTAEIGGIMASVNRDAMYSAYYERHRNDIFPDSMIVINACNGVPENDTGGFAPEYEICPFGGEENCLVWRNGGGRFIYTFTAEEAGNYCLELYYHTVPGMSTTTDLGILIDGDYPFTACRDITPDRFWEDSTGILRDSRDNDIRPVQQEKNMWVTYPLKDKEGLFNSPYFFNLSAGEHTLTLEGIRTDIALKRITFRNYDAPPDYAAPSRADIEATPAISGEINAIGSNTILLQGETPFYRTDRSVFATYDRTSCLVSPSHPTKQRYNTIGAENWKKAGQAVTWKFSVPAGGFYNISFKVRQNTMRGMYSNRRIYIDGFVPNREADTVSFPYDPEWYVKRLESSSGDDMYLYLDKGEHTITLEVVPGDIGEIMRRLDDIIYDLSYYYRRILMITGPKPDEYNDYYLDRQIPGLVEALNGAAEALYREKANIEKLGQGSEAAPLEALAVILRRCTAKPDEIPQMTSSLRDYISAASAWMRDYRDQPLEIDYIEVLTCHEQPGRSKGNFFEEFGFGFEAFIGSFFEDYTMLSGTDADSLNVWVALGRDQANVVKELTDSGFNAEHKDIHVNINLVQGSVLEASLAGKGPDIALFLGGDFPIQCAARDLLVDLSDFPDYESVVSERFVPSAETLYTYSGGVYGLPVSMSFPMMFVRTDILGELGINDIPQTWDDLVGIIPVLQRSHLSAGLVRPASDMTSSVFEPGDTFAMLVLQTGGNMYSDSLSETTFGRKEIADVFRKWTEFYTIYNTEQVYDPFTRFRTGEMPIVISNYPFCNQLMVSAPEIKGLWDFTHVPGTVDPVSGEINYTANPGSSGAVIFNKCADKQGAWEFIKWFTSDEVMSEYGRLIEGRTGQMGRFDTANKNALAFLSWSDTEYRKIADQMENTVGIPVIPASYAVTRHVKNAFRAVVNDHWNPGYSLSYYNKDINYEIERKNAALAQKGR